jgi:hypothetical protein
MEDCYSRLRSIGCSVETADALAPILIELSDCKREAFYLWAMDIPERQIVEITGLSKGTIYRLLEGLRGKCL